MKKNMIHPNMGKTGILSTNSFYKSKSLYNNKLRFLSFLCIIWTTILSIYPKVNGSDNGLIKHIVLNKSENHGTKKSKSGEYGNLSPLTSLKAFTISAWIKTDYFKSGKYYAVASKSGKNKNGLEWALYHAGWNNMFSFIIETASGERRVSVSPGYLIGEWRFIAVTYTPENLEMYIDGKLVAKSKGGGNIATGSGKLLIGKLRPDSLDVFPGSIKEISIYNRALPAKEIKQLFGPPKNSILKVVDVPAPMYIDCSKTTETKAENVADCLRTMRSIDWHIAPEATSNEIEQIVTYIKQQGFNSLFQSGSFRYIMGQENYGDRNWWNTIPWETYKSTIKKISSTCRKYNIKFVLHLTANLAMKEDYQKYFKGMACRNLKNNSEAEWKNYYGYALCSNNPQFRKIYLSRLRELIAITMPDGLMVDEVAISPTNQFCGCKYCRSLFKEEYGFETPNPDDKTYWYNYNNPKWLAWQEFRKQTVDNWNKVLKTCLIDANKNGFYTGCCCNPLYGPLSVWCGYDPLSKHNDIFFYESEPLNPWSWRHAVAEGKWANANNRPVMLLGYAASLSQEYFQTLLSMSQGWAIHQWVEFDDFRSVPVVWQKKWKSLWLGNEQFCNVAIVSPTTHLSNKYFYDEKKDYAEYNGWAEALTEAHIQFEVLLPEKLNNLNKYKILILPDVLCLSDNANKLLTDYVQAGGTIIATDETSLFNAKGKKLDDFGLKKLFGISYKAEFNSIEPISCPKSLIAKGKLTLPEKTRKISILKAQTIARLMNSKQAVITENRYGTGRCFYIAFNPGVKYFMPKIGHGWYGTGGYWYDTRLPEAKEFMINLVRSCAPQDFITQEIPSEILVNCVKQKYKDNSGIVVHMLNLLGTKFEGYVKVPDNKEYEFVDYPSPNKFIRDGKKMKIIINIPNISGAYMISPDFEGIVKLNYEKNSSNRSYTVTIPDLGRYAILYLTIKGDAITKKSEKILKEIPSKRPFKIIYTCER